MEIEAYAEAPATGLLGGVGTTDTLYPPAGTLDLTPAATGIRLTAWRGERVNSQIVITADAIQTNLHIEPALL